MARPATGLSILDMARKQLKEAVTVEELRSAQAVIFPLELGLSMEETGRLIGCSASWACQRRRRLIKQKEHAPQEQAVRARPGSGRGRSYLSRDEEKALLLPFIKKASQGGILVVNEIRRALEKKCHRKTAQATVYNLLHRHQWRKLAPDKQHPKSNVEVQEAWKKNFLNSCKTSKKHGKARGQVPLD